MIRTLSFRSCTSWILFLLVLGQSGQGQASPGKRRCTPDDKHKALEVALNPDFDPGIVPSRDDGGAEMLRRMRPYVGSLAHRERVLLARMNIDQEDLVQELNLHLLKAWPYWDPKKGLSWFGYLKNGVDKQWRRIVWRFKQESNGHVSHTWSDLGVGPEDSAFSDIGEFPGAALSSASRAFDPSTVQNVADQLRKETPELSREDATILSLAWTRGMTSEEIAQATGESSQRIEKLLEHTAVLGDEVRQGADVYRERARRQRQAHLSRRDATDYLGEVGRIRASAPVRFSPSLQLQLIQTLIGTTLHPLSDTAFWRRTDREALLRAALGKSYTPLNVEILEMAFTEPQPISQLANKLGLSPSWLRTTLRRTTKRIAVHPQVIATRNELLMALKHNGFFSKLAEDLWGSFSDDQLGVAFTRLFDPDLPPLEISARYSLSLNSIRRIRDRVRASIEERLVQAVAKLPEPLNKAGLLTVQPYARKQSPWVTRNAARSLVDRWRRGIPFSLQPSRGTNQRLEFMQHFDKVIRDRYGVQLEPVHHTAAVQALLPPKTLAYTTDQLWSWARELMSNQKGPRRLKYMDRSVLQSLQHHLALYPRMRDESIPAALLVEHRLPVWIVRAAIRDVERSIGHEATLAWLKEVLGETASLRSPTTALFVNSLRAHIAECRSLLPDPEQVLVSWSSLVGLPLFKGGKNLERDTWAILEHFANGTNLTSIGTELDLTKELIRLVVQAADERMSLWIHREVKNLARVHIDTRDEMRQAFLIQRTRGKRLAKATEQLLLEASVQLPAESHELIQMQLKEGLVPSSIVSRLKTREPEIDAKEVIARIKSAKGPLEDVLFAIKAYRAFPGGSLKLSEAEAIPLLILYRDLYKTSLLPSVQELVEILEDLREAVSAMQHRPSQIDLFRTYGLLYERHESVRSAARRSPQTPVAGIRAAQRELLSHLRETLAIAP